MHLQRLAASILDRAEIDYARSGGPGGQNVNKVNTRVIARIALFRLEGLDEKELQLVRARLAGRITRNDELVVSVQEERSQLQNQRRAMDRLIFLIANTARRQAVRIPTRRTLASREQNLALKRLRSQIKLLRRKPADE